jgi:hypothetical protein
MNTTELNRRRPHSSVMTNLISGQKRQKSDSVHLSDNFLSCDDDHTATEIYNGRADDLVPLLAVSPPHASLPRAGLVNPSHR